MRDIEIDFSGGLTSQPAWFFQGNGIKNDVRVALTIQKPWIRLLSMLEQPGYIKLVYLLLKKLAVIPKIS